jgi:SPP1 family predicted phage head-tail adaptor
MGVSTVPQSNSPILQIGKLRHRIQIVQPGVTQDSAGGTTQTDATVLCTTWATIQALSGTEKFAAHEFVSQVTHSVYLRYRTDFTIDSSMNVWYNGRTFQIEAVLNPDERNKMLQLLCIEINDAAQQGTTPAESAS